MLFQIRNGISPNVFKLLIGRGHPEFSSKRQQDAQEYLMRLFSIIEVTVLVLVFCSSSLDSRSDYL